MREQLGVVRRHRKEQCRAEPRNDIEDAFWLGWTGEQDAGASNGQWKIESVAQPICEKELRNTKEAVVFAGVENLLRVAFRAYHHIVLQMHTGLGPSCAPGRIQPESSIVFAGGSRFQIAGRIANPAVKRSRSGSFVADDDDFLEGIAVAVGDLLQMWEEGVCNNCNPRSRIVKQILVISRP